jgi:hypothetical protein
MFATVRFRVHVLRLSKPLFVKSVPLSAHHAHGPMLRNLSLATTADKPIPESPSPVFSPATRKNYGTGAEFESIPRALFEGTTTRKGLGPIICTRRTHDANGIGKQYAATSLSTEAVRN